MMLNERSKFKLLCSKDILLILIGDTKCSDRPIKGVTGDIEVSMPNLSWRELSEVVDKAGLPETCRPCKDVTPRYNYLGDMLNRCVKNNVESKLLSYLFSKRRFSEKLKGNTKEFVESTYIEITDAVINKINGKLYFEDCELERYGDQFVIHQIGSSDSMAKVETPTLKSIDRSYISEFHGRMEKDLKDGNYDSAITKSRTLLEEVFCYMIEAKGKEPTQSGEIGKLFYQVKQLYNMLQGNEQDKRINELLCGLEKILSSIVKMRNKNSDAHGVGAKRINIANHHARLVVNSALTMAEFMLAVHEKASQ